MLKTDIAWAAGFFDGEGHISVRKQKTKSHKRGICHTLIITADQLDLSPLLKLRKIFGGKVTTYTSFGSGKKVGVWRLRQNEMKTFLHSVLPFITTKKKECILGLQFLTTVKSANKISNSIFTRREKLYKKLREVKRIKYGTRRNK
jgi:hypothetical protein